MSIKPKLYTVDEIVKIVTSERTEMVTVTGGEPTIHPMWLLETLAFKLRDRGRYITMETNGTNPTSLEFDWITCSPKPDNDYKIHTMCDPDELKYVVDATFNYGCIDKRYLDLEVLPIYVQPESMKPKSIKRCIELVKRHPRLRLGIQLHKVLEVR